MSAILVVDDDPMLRRVAALALGRAGFEVLLAASGEEAISIATERAPSLVLLDQLMPGLDGAATLAKLRADPRTASIRVAMLTADPDDKALRARCGELGVCAVLAKPFDPRALGAQVLALLG